LELASSAGKALGFAQKIVYYCKETIRYLLAKAHAEGNKLEELQPAEKTTKNAPQDNPEELVSEEEQVSKISEASKKEPATEINEKKKEDSEEKPKEEEK